MALNSLLQSLLSFGKMNSYKDGDVLYSLEKKRQLISELLNKMNCVYSISHDKRGLLFDFQYQGNSFSVLLQKSIFDQMIYPDFREVPFSKLSWVQTFCNKLNQTPSVIRVAYKYDEKENVVKLSAYVNFTLTDDLSKLENYFGSLLQNCFVTRDLCLEYYEHSQSDEYADTRNSEERMMELSRQFYLIKEQELLHQPEYVHKWVEHSDVIQLEDFIEKAFGLQEVELLNMYVQRLDNDAKLEFVDENETIRSYNLLASLIKGQGSNATFICDKANLILTFREPALQEGVFQTMNILLQKWGDTEQTLYVRLTACIPPCGLQRDISISSPRNRLRSISMLLAYDKSSDKQHRSEFKYMWHDVLDKIKHHKVSDLTEDQKLIYVCEGEDVASRIYWGHKYFLDKRYYQALSYLEEAYAAMERDYEVMSTEMLDKFYRVCYMIGFCYSELKQYAKAFFFLDIVAVQNNILYLKTYVNCLVKAKDFRALDVIGDMIEKVEETYAYDEEEGKFENEAAASFYRFLREREVIAYLNDGDLGAAEELCSILLKDPKSKDYALRELARIQKLRRDLGLIKEDEK